MTYVAYPSKSARREQRREEMSRRYAEAEMVEQARRREHRAYHAHVVEQLEAAGIDPDALVAFIRGYPK